MTSPVEEPTDYIAEAITEAFGERCPEYAEGCHTCEVWKQYDGLMAAEEALIRIEAWSEAYPLEVFPEPDLKKARALLEAGGMTLDAISASAMRHVVDGVGQIAKQAIRSKQKAATS